MTHVATLIAHPDHPYMEDAHAWRAAQRLTDRRPPEWLHPGVAVDLRFTPPGVVDCRAIADDLRNVNAPAPYDVIVQPVAHRRKRLFVADMDSTMIGQECIDELADLVGLKDRVAAITERAMRGEIAFEPALRERVGLLRDLEASVVDEVIERRVTLTAGGRALVRTMRAAGAHTALVSGGFTLFTRPIAERIGFDENHGNRLEVVDGRLTGVVAEPILGREAKRSILAALTGRLGLDRRETLAVGDGANDLSMLAEAGLGIAFRAKPAVAAAAGARVDHSTLAALLYAQGYRRDEFADREDLAPLEPARAG